MSIASLYCLICICSSFNRFKSSLFHTVFLRPRAVSVELIPVFNPLFLKCLLLLSKVQNLISFLHKADTDQKTGLPFIQITKESNAVTI